MIRVLLPLVLLIIGIGAGSGAAFFLSPDTEAASDEVEEAQLDEDSSDGAEAISEESHSEEPRVTAGSADDLEYVRLNNQFIVPIVENGAVRSLVVMSLTLEISAGENQLVFDREPRIRDAFLRVMFSHANSGGFDDVFTSSLAMAPLRRGLRDAAIEILGPVVNDVLIVDIVRQDA